jgi:hypothetical protein
MFALGLFKSVSGSCVHWKRAAYSEEVDSLQEIDALLEHQGRRAGSDAERRAARHLTRRLRDLGREAEVEAIEVWPRWPFAHACHALLALAGTLISVSAPIPGAALLLAVAVSFVGDLTGRLRLGRRLTGRRASQNVVSREDGGRPGVLVLMAHYDAGRTGAVYGGRSALLLARLGRLIRRPIGALEPVLWAMVAGLACAVARALGAEANAVSAVQFTAAVVLIVSVPLLLDIALSGVVAGANDNASGVVTALRLGDRYGGSLDHFDLWVVLTGAGEALADGARAFARRHRRELDPRATVFICLDAVGAGTVRWSAREGPLVARRHHRGLLALCEEIADDDADAGDRYGAQPFVLREFGDAAAARTAGFPAVTLSCRDELDRAPHSHQAADLAAKLEPDALERAYGFGSELIELIDDETGPRLEDSDVRP